VNAQHFQQDIAGSRLVVLPGLGHVPQEEDAQASVAPAREFLGLDAPVAAAAAAR
jgi:pimeloyl-ACP methyl ester carboxylesterase